MTMIKTWNPCAILNASGIGYNYAILILNRPIVVPYSKSKILNLWQNAAVRITVDGGTDRWLTWLEKNNISSDSIKQPDLITGDMDSIKMETLEMFKNSSNSTIVLTEDQNETDYTKALRELKKYAKQHQKQIDFVITIVDDSGRFDQIVANINTLFKATSFLPATDIIALSGEAATWLLWTGNHKIQLPTRVLQHSKWCSVIPISANAYVTTSGLKWNLSNSLLAFGHMVSTSNTFSNSPEVTVTTDNPIVWSMGMNSKTID